MTAAAAAEGSSSGLLQRREFNPVRPTRVSMLTAGDGARHGGRCGSVPAMPGDGWSLGSNVTKSMDARRGRSGGGVEYSTLDVMGV